MNSAIFLDRDGVVIENVDRYVRSWSDVVVLPGVLEALAKLKGSSYKIIIITNQSAVGRGIISLEEAQRLNNRLVRVVEAVGGRIDDVFMCPHAPDDLCDCRKPKPGLLIQAASRHKLDLRRSILIGDALSDIQAGLSAGIGQNVLVRTGRGSKQILLPEAAQMGPFKVFDRLADVVDALYAGLLPVPVSDQ